MTARALYILATLWAGLPRPFNDHLLGYRLNVIDLRSKPSSHGTRRVDSSSSASDISLANPSGGPSGKRATAARAPSELGLSSLRSRRYGAIHSLPLR